jgi:hypothetical protein
VIGMIATGGVVDELLEPVTVVPERTMPTTVERRNASAAELPVLRSSRTLVRGTEPNPQLEPSTDSAPLLAGVKATT